MHMQQVTPIGVTLKDCHLSTMWDSKLLSPHALLRVFELMLFPVDLYQSADVANRKAEIASFNKVITI